MIYFCAVILACINLGNSLGSTENQLPDEERYGFFDAELLQVYNSKEKGNFLISPISVKFVLGMLLEGTKERTAEEIRTALRLPEDEEAERKEFSGWLSLLQEKESPNVFKIANRMFLSNKYQINRDYGKILKKYYSAGVTDIKFEKGKEASQTINSWISNQTSHLITNILAEDDINPEDKFILTSVVYFKGLWSTPFVSERSAVRCFYSKKNQCTDVRMMAQTGFFDYGYVSRLDAKAIVMPYQGKKLSMLFLLPTKRDGIEQLGRDLIHVSLKSILAEVKENEVFVQIPQFEISFNDDLVESLQKLQVSRVFSQNANLSKIFTNNTKTTPIRHIYHSTKITVDETGSEAAAATAVLFVPLMGGPTTSFIANHPFVFFLIDATKSVIIFAGKVVTPKTVKDSKKDAFHINSATDTPKHRIIKENGVTPQVGTLKVARNQTQRAQGPKFRSINQSAFSAPQTSTNDETFIDDFSSISTFYKNFLTRPNTYIEKEQTHKKRGKTPQNITKKPKRQEVQNDDWRHHVLYFT